MVVSRSRIIATCSGDLTLGGDELEELKSLRILGVTLDSKLTFEIHLREVVSKTARSLVVVRRVGKSFICPRVLKSCFTAYVLSSLEYCPPLPYRCRRRSLIWVRWIELFAVRKVCVGAQKESHYFTFAL